MFDRKSSRVRLFVGIPSYVTRPSVGMQRSKAKVSVDFPAPVRPTATGTQVGQTDAAAYSQLYLPTPIRSPAFISKDKSCNTFGPSYQ